MDPRLATDSNSPPASPLRQSRSGRAKQTTRFYRTEHGKMSLSGVIKSNPKTGMIESKGSSSLRLPKEKHKQYTSPLSPSSSLSSITGNIINTRKHIRDVYGPFLCSILCASTFMVIVGSALTLSGFYVPVLPLEHLKSNIGGVDEEYRRAQIRNSTLAGLRISGVVLLVIGLIGIIILFLTPVICLRRTEYTLLPSDDTVRTHSSFSSASGLPDDMFTFSVVKQQIQPKKHASPSGKAGSKGLRTSVKHRPHYDKGFLSPELNRGPIFVSDGDRDLHSKDNRKHRNRSSSFDSRLTATTRYSPQLFITSKHHQERPRYSIPGILTPDHPLSSSGPIKAGSFHSLR